MKATKLTRLLGTFSAADWRQAKLFVQSPYYNQRQDVLDLFDHLRQALVYGRGSLQPQKVWSKLYPKEEYRDAKLKSTAHFLFQILKRFLSVQSFEQSPHLSQLHLCQTLRKRQLDSMFEREISLLEQSHQALPIRNRHYHYRNFQLQVERYEYNYRKQRSGKKNLQELVTELTVFYLAAILRYSCVVLTAQRISTEKYQLDLLDDILQYTDRSPLRDTPAIAVYYQAYRLLDAKENAVALTDYVGLVEEHWQKFPTEEARDLYLIAINYCIAQLNQGHREFIAEALGLYRHALERGLLFEDGLLSKYTYNNILMLAIARREWDWATAFLEEHRVHLPPKDGRNIYRYNLAILYFRRPDYTKAQELLRDIVLNDPLYNLNTRSMLLRIYYETEAFDALESLLDSFRAYIQRQEKIGYHKENYLKLIQFVRQLWKTAPTDKQKISKLRQAVSQETRLAEKPWLLEQIDQRLQRN